MVDDLSAKVVIQGEALKLLGTFVSSFCSQGHEYSQLWSPKGEALCWFSHRLKLICNVIQAAVFQVHAPQKMSTTKREARSAPRL